jgi:antitoxin (DNA-binding transcriptional repressor) of toxin-antitoxin stability system
MSALVNIADFKNKLAQYLALIEQGHEVIVCRRNRPIARCEAVRRGRVNRTKFGSMKGTVQILGDLTEPLIPEEDWEMLK